MRQCRQAVATIIVKYMVVETHHILAGSIFISTHKGSLLIDSTRDCGGIICVADSRQLAEPTAHRAAFLRATHRTEYGTVGNEYLELGSPAVVATQYTPGILTRGADVGLYRHVVYKKRAARILVHVFSSVDSPDETHHITCAD